jgi:hypothetical protein
MKLLGGLGVLGALIFESGGVMLVLFVIAVPVALGTVAADVAPTFFSYVGWALPLAVYGLLAIGLVVALGLAMTDSFGAFVGTLFGGALLCLVVSVVFWILFTLTASAFVLDLEGCPVAHLPKGPEFCSENDSPQPPFFHFNKPEWGNF